MSLPEKIFKEIVASTPLISIDLIVRDTQGKVLLGKRTNRPAQGYWFVPGGRILKDESIELAFKRLLIDELGLDFSAVKTSFIGTYQHFYDDNFFDSAFSTHYVVLAYQIILQNDLASIPNEQHSSYNWFSENELLNDDNVHLYSKWYFQKGQHADDTLLSKLPI
ncbi:MULTISPECIES: GDP-mannose mannosyl hydrolase [unclassified Colwellia]|uniref:GDP-mannose mannosyl hydrolase n=1 Tax=unclassified Colwellia TaxID=196834 RepID=UPI0015F389DD|nr:MULTISPECIES: GDP-mannose mannosyl hydrolase [unclassified Colwellia]MBA6257126.1 GDP-mannose mannosyl hydrolase [Colwellia sp. MB3u-28]MBA6258642.1 GDP-mannose mannosyl hydrolase [Colwellia sp. MB3u-41]